MKLTNYLRDAFISAAMADVPAGKDFENAITDAVQADFVAQLPPAVLKVWKDSNTRGFIKVSSFNDLGVSVAVPHLAERWSGVRKDALTAATLKKLEALSVEWAADKEMRKSLSAKLRAAAYGCNTRKALADLLPEFAHYLPPEEGPASRTVPVVQNMVADFVKAGWPKNKKVKEGRAHG